MAANGFAWRYNLSGGRPLIHSFYTKDAETWHSGDMVNIETGEADLAVTTDAALAGAFVGPLNPADGIDGKPGQVLSVDSTTLIKVIINPDAVYGCFDANARQPGATLDITGATGAQTATTSTNTEFVVVERKRATADETRVMIIGDNHFLAKAL